MAGNFSKTSLCLKHHWSHKPVQRRELTHGHHFVTSGLEFLEALQRLKKDSDCLGGSSFRLRNCRILVWGGGEAGPCSGPSPPLKFPCFPTSGSPSSGRLNGQVGALQSQSRSFLAPSPGCGAGHVSPAALSGWPRPSEGPSGELCYICLAAPSAVRSPQREASGRRWPGRSPMCQGELLAKPGR